MPAITKIILQDMHFPAPIDVDAWKRPSKPTQPILFSMTVIVLPPKEQFQESRDEVAIDYSTLSAMVLKCARSPAAQGAVVESSYPLQPVLNFHAALATNVFSKWPSAGNVNMSTVLPVGIHGAAAKAVWSSEIWPDSHKASLNINDIRAAGYIGLRDHEKGARQTIMTSLRFTFNEELTAIFLKAATVPLNAHTFAECAVETVEANKKETVEGLLADLVDALRSRLGGLLGQEIHSDTQPDAWPIPMTLIRVIKPDALPCVDGAGVQLELEY